MQNKLHAVITENNSRSKKESGIPIHGTVILPLHSIDCMIVWEPLKAESDSEMKRKVKWDKLVQSPTVSLIHTQRGDVLTSSGRVKAVSGFQVSRVLCQTAPAHTNTRGAVVHLLSSEKKNTNI